MALALERKKQSDGTTYFPGGMLAPVTDEDYWEYRVRLSDTQAVVGFPKFGTIGIGFAVEEDWNTNLPYTSDTDKIVGHILHNKGDDSIADESVREAVAMIQAAATQDRGK